MKLPTLLFVIAIIAFGFMLVWDGDAALRTCEAVRGQSTEGCLYVLR